MTERRVLVVPSRVVKSAPGMQLLTEDERDTLFGLIDHWGFWGDKKEAETNTNFQQVIPCIVFMTRKGVPVFKRVLPTGEPRLKDQLTVTAAGHVEAEDGDRPMEAFYRAMVREAMEETPYLWSNVLSPPEFIGVIKMGGDGVSGVHMGLVHIALVEIDRNPRGSEELEFMGYIRTVEHAEDFGLLEEWSRVIIEHLPHVT